MANENTLNSMTEYIKNVFHVGSSYPTVLVRSSVDNRQYKVRDLPDKQKAADTLANIRIRLQTLMESLVEKYPNKPQIERLKKNFKPDPSRFFESTPDAEHTSYSVNKGEAVHICLRQRDGTEGLINENIMMFVALHEMSHMITENIGHGPEFWNNFGWLLREAEETQLYKPVNFKAHPVMYCGISITDSPKYDPNKDIESGTNFTIGKMF